MNQRISVLGRLAIAGGVVVSSALFTSMAGTVSGAQVGNDDFQISQATPTPEDSRIAYNATDEEYLVVWASVDGSLESRIYGRIIDARTGAGVTNEFLIAELNGGDPTTGHIEPDVVWNSVDNEYVVVSAADDTIDMGLIVTTFEIYAQRVSAAGTLVGGSVRVSDLGTDDTNGSFDANQPAIAHDPGNNRYLVVFDGDDDTGTLGNGDDEIFGQLLTAALTLPGGAGNDVRLSDMGAEGDGSADARTPAIAWDGLQYLVVWEGDDDSVTFEIHGQYVNADGTEAGPDFLVSTDPANDEAYDASVAADTSTGDSLVVWEHDNGAGNDFEIEGAFVNGGPGTSFPISEVGNSLFNVERPAVAYHAAADAYSVVWTGDHSTLTSDNDHEVFHVLLDDTGAELEAIEQVSSMAAATTQVGDADVAAGPETASGIVWSGVDAAATDTEVWGQFVAPDTDLTISSKVLNTPATIVPGDPVEYLISYANDGDVPATNVTITDTIPAGITISSVVTTGPTLTQTVGETYEWTIANLPANTSGTITLTGSADAGAEGLITNTATISGNPLHADSVMNDSASVDVTVDAAPSVVVTAVAALTNTSPVSFTAQFSEDVTGFADGDVDLSASTAAGTLTATVTPVDAANYTIDVTGMTGDGDIVVTVPADSANDTGPLTQGNTVSNEATSTYDTTAPVGTWSTALSDPTNASPLTATVTFNEPVTGFGPGAFSVSNGVLDAGLIVSTTEFDLTYTPSSDGPVGITALAGAFTDAAGNTNPATTLTLTSDRTAPTVTVEQAAGQADPTSTSPIDFTATFDEDVTGFGDGDVALGGSAGATTAVVSGGPAVYNIAVSGMTGDGTVTASIDAAVATDLAGNANVASTSTDNEVTYDATAPTPVIASGEPDPTNSDPFDVSIDFGESVSGFVDTDITVGNGTVTNLTDDGGGAFTATIDATADGTVTVDVAAGVATDAAGTDNLAAVQFSIVVDTTAPELTLVQAVGQADPTNTATVEFTVTANEDVSGLDGTDVVLSGPAAAGATPVISGGPAVYTLTVSGITVDGELTAAIADGGASDAAGNASVTNPSPDPTVTVDLTAPTVMVEQGAGQADPTNTEPIVFDVVFSEDVTGLDSSDLTIGGTAGATTASVTAVDASTYTVAVSGTVGDGTVTLDVAAGGVTDAAGNVNAASTSTDNDVTYDATAPTVTIEQGATQTDSANASPIVFDVVFSEDVTGFDETDVTLGGSAGATTATVTPIDGASYTVAVSGMTGDGTVTATVDAAAAVDAAGNDSEGSTSTDNMVTFISGDPTPGVNDAPSVTAAATASAELAVTTTFTGADAASVTDPDALDADIVVTVTADDDETIIEVIAAGSATVAGNASDAVTITGSQSDINATLASLSVTANNVGDITITIAADDQGNTDGGALTDTATTVITVTDTVAPTITAPDAVTASADPGEAGAIVTFDVTVDDPGSESPARLIEAQPAPTLDCDPNSGSFFPIGDTTVSCTATDASGNSSTESFVVTVTDDENPVITGATDQQFTLPLGTSGVVTYTTPTASDNSGSATITCTPASGSTLSAGDTTVNCTATDASGNTASASFTLDVVSGRIPDTGGSLTFLPWAGFLLGLGVVLLGSVGVSRRRLAR